jgi:hypothetical protein
LCKKCSSSDVRLHLCLLNKQTGERIGGRSLLSFPSFIQFVKFINLPLPYINYLFSATYIQTFLGSISSWSCAFVFCASFCPLDIDVSFEAVKCEKNKIPPRGNHPNQTTLFCEIKGLKDIFIRSGH